MMKNTNSTKNLEAKKRSRKHEEALLAKLEHLNQGIHYKEAQGLGKLISICHHCRLSKNPKKLVYWISNDCSLTYCTKCIEPYSYSKSDIQIFSKNENYNNLDKHFTCLEEQYLSENSEASVKQSKKLSNTRCYKYEHLKRKLGGYVNRCPVWTRKCMCQTWQKFFIEQDLEHMKNLILNNIDFKPTDEDLPMPQTDEQMDVIKQNNWAIRSSQAFKLNDTKGHQDENLHNYNSIDIFTNKMNSKSAFSLSRTRNNHKFFKTGEDINDLINSTSINTSLVNSLTVKQSFEEIKTSNFDWDSTDDFGEGLSSVSIILPICTKPKSNQQTKWNDSLYNSRISGNSMVNKMNNPGHESGPFRVMRHTKNK